ncbi:hypothetical protein E2562_026231 [Oryza meyeriana var. granulata]|uniref:Reverse transcriptase zinc-binding domain-containing protein n=1 Tax=Oryza meyeriana var. granulata TaxID=110450 RepID=A0A6G1CIK1_9ORYZ|nr:hypothetical protein E2562_026231 [Oryza meyeriana var. granulata]
MARFWDLAWMNGNRPKDLAPLVFAISKKKSRTLQQAIQGETWIQDLNLTAQEGMTVQLLDQLVTLWNAVQGVQLEASNADSIRWKLTAHGESTAESAYKAQFFWLHNNKLRVDRLETLGAKKMQVVCLAHHPKQSMDV